MNPKARSSILPRLVVLLVVFSLRGWSEEPYPAEIEQAFSRLYNFDFPGAHKALDRHLTAHPDDPLGYAMRCSAYLFYELDRLGILESDFFSDDKRIADKKNLKPDPAIRARFFQAVEAAQSHALAILRRDPNNADALFAMCITQGVVTDYTALVEKHQIRSLSGVKRSTAYAQRLLQLNPQYYDAYLTTGMTEYLVGCLPFVVRWFVRINDITGSKEKGIGNLELVAHEGHYLKPFAKICLAVAYLREKKPEQAQVELAELARDYPENPLFKKELAKVAQKVRENGRRGN